MTRKAKTKRPTTRTAAGQKVGRGNPPQHTRFQKGASGNPKGRPKGSKNLSTLIMEAARDPVTATVDGRTRRISKIQATTTQLATKAASGDHAAMGKFLDWIDEIETRAAAVKPTQFPLSEPDLEVLRAAYERMKECEQGQPES
jgi:alpha-beta hydrolase superfamily lysophospholipase